MHRKPHERLRELREQKGFKGQKHFCAHAAKLGLPIKVRRYGSIERGDVTPSQEDIINICRAMDISADAWLFGNNQAVDLRSLSKEDVQVITRVIAGLSAK